jgi:hypothetical protein
MVVFTAAPTQRGTQQRWFGVACSGLNAIDQMFFLAGYPFWSLTIIAADIVAI